VVGKIINDFDSKPGTDQGRRALVSLEAKDSVICGLDVLGGQVLPIVELDPLPDLIFPVGPVRGHLP
jgi:hypothetical protein